MIHIDRTSEACCPELAAAREQELDRVRTALHAGVPLSNELLGQRYDVARPHLYEMQHHKCCYCESRQNSHKWNTTEHFRPKTAVERDGATQPGYWWLTWTWSNLLFCCTQCNSYKHIHFPLTGGSVPLSAEELPPGKEQPLLLDPCEDGAQCAPQRHIQFRPVADNWWPFPRNGSARGEEFLTRLRFYHPELGIRRAGLVSKWRAHAKGLQPAIAQVKAALRDGSQSLIQSTWAAQVTPHLFCSQEFVALSIDVFDHEFGAELRAQYGLQLEPVPLPA
jgi:hypothetical protein